MATNKEDLDRKTGSESNNLRVLQNTSCDDDIDSLYKSAGAEELGSKNISCEEIDRFYKAAMQGDAEAQTELGILCTENNIVVVDPNSNEKVQCPNLQLAAYWYYKAAIQGHSKAQNNLGSLCIDNNVVVVDPNSNEKVQCPNKQLAADWIYKSAIQGNDTAQFNLGLFCTSYNIMVVDPNSNEKVQCPNLQLAADWYYKAAMLGNVVAQNNLAPLCNSNKITALDPNTGQKIICPNPQLAADWLYQAAMRGVAHSQIELARFCALGKVSILDPVTGRMVECPDKQLAADWLYKAAIQNNAIAQFELGHLYKGDKSSIIDPATNKVVKLPNLQLAADWLYKAAKNNVACAQAELGQLCLENDITVPDPVTGVTVKCPNPSLSMFWQSKAVNQKHTAIKEHKKTIFEHIDNNNLPELKKLLQQFPHLVKQIKHDEIKKEGYTPISYADHKHNTAIVLWLDINASLDEPIFEAVKKGNLDAVKTILTANANDLLNKVNDNTLRDKVNRNLLIIAAIHNRTKIIAWLLDNTASDINFIGADTIAETALGQAIEYQQTDAVKLFLSEPYLTKITNLKDYLPCALQYRNLEITKSIINVYSALQIDYIAPLLQWINTSRKYLKSKEFFCKNLPFIIEIFNTKTIADKAQFIIDYHSMPSDDPLLHKNKLIQIQKEFGQDPQLNLLVFILQNTTYLDSEEAVKSSDMLKKKRNVLIKVIKELQTKDLIDITVTQKKITLHTNKQLIVINYKDFILATEEFLNTTFDNMNDNGVIKSDVSVDILAHYQLNKSSKEATLSLKIEQDILRDKLTCIKLKCDSIAKSNNSTDLSKQDAEKLRPIDKSFEEALQCISALQSYTASEIAPTSAIQNDFDNKTKNANTEKNKLLNTYRIATETYHEYIQKRDESINSFLNTYKAIEDHITKGDLSAARKLINKYDFSGLESTYVKAFKEAISSFETTTETYTQALLKLKDSVVRANKKNQYNNAISEQEKKRKEEENARRAAEEQARIETEKRETEIREQKKKLWLEQMALNRAARAQENKRREAQQSKSPTYNASVPALVFSTIMQPSSKSSFNINAIDKIAMSSNLSNNKAQLGTLIKHITQHDTSSLSNNDVIAYSFAVLQKLAELFENIKNTNSTVFPKDLAANMRNTIWHAVEYPLLDNPDTAFLQSLIECSKNVLNYLSIKNLRWLGTSSSNEVNITFLGNRIKSDLFKTLLSYDLNLEKYNADFIGNNRQCITAITRSAESIPQYGDKNTTLTPTFIAYANAFFRGRSAALAKQSGAAADASEHLIGTIARHESLPSQSIETALPYSVSSNTDNYKDMLLKAIYDQLPIEMRNSFNTLSVFKKAFDDEFLPENGIIDNIHAITKHAATICKCIIVLNIDNKINKLETSPQYIAIPTEIAPKIETHITINFVISPAMHSSNGNTINRKVF